MAEPGGNALARWTDHAIDRIDCRKSEMLAGAVLVTAILTVAGIADVAAGNGNQLTKSVVDAGGYLACLAILLGLPALVYAMVADRSIAALSASERAKMHDRIADLLGTRAKELHARGYQLQVFRPNWRDSRLLPFYDPFQIGPKEGWNIAERAPQAITGSAWVTHEYTFAEGGELQNADLHLTDEQRRRYSDLTGVAATPIFDAAGERLAILTFCTKQPHPGIQQPATRDLQLALATELSHELRRIVGPLDFPAVTPETSVSEQAGRMEVTEEVTEALPTVEAAAQEFFKQNLPELEAGDDDH